ncbi:MAG: rRNA (cytidine1920-2-O)/16S rRNA (cytidine1409-2-O)-methyltransferase [Actinomycetota bacterium]|nr:rRNA (cytidine1920-2-O)/16S rRNA (cytidine1409-2-O)-methyltransferase [Actinomycetota bacterium]
MSGAVAEKPSRLVDPSEPIELRGAPPRFVSRGGEKLDAALERFSIDVDDRRCLDAGASTGGFTDCLLQRGAREVIAVDVGFGQLHERLRADARVRNRERCNIRSLAPGDIGGPVELTVADLSFISLRTVLPALLDLTDAAGTIVLLVKPQFEAGRQEASRNRGVIRDPAVWRRVLDEVCSAVISGGATMMGAMVSPLRGADGNVEFLVLVEPRPGDGGVTAVDLDAVVAGVDTEG